LIVVVDGAEQQRVLKLFDVQLLVVAPDGQRYLYT
jgi:hypothetical protein